MSLRIAFDLDGVLADMDGAFAREAEVLFGLQPDAVDDGAAGAVPPEGATGRPAVRGTLSSRQINRLWRRVEQIDGFWELLEETEAGAVARLATLATDRRWEVIFITRRPATAGATPQLQTQRWLEARGFRLPSVYVVQGSRGAIAAALALDIVVDDRPENCLDVVVDSDARAILVWRDDASELPAAARRLGIGVVRSVAECLDILEVIDAASNDQPTLVTRFMRFFGVKASEAG